VVDTGIGKTAQRLIARLQQLAAKRIIVVFTHCHYDHCGAAAELQHAFGKRVTFAAHERDANAIEDAHSETTLDYLFNAKATPVRIAMRLKDGDVIKNENFSFVVMHTPGHTAGSISLYDEANGMLVSGDSLDGYRTDLPTGSAEAQAKSIGRVRARVKRSVRHLHGHGLSKQE
jgi:glyoxylase-like metal-dependent hydrolase (beta-lactamase superfamily II)